MIKNSLLPLSHVLKQDRPPAGFPWSKADWRKLQNVAAGYTLECDICHKKTRPAAGNLVPIPGRGLFFICNPHYWLLKGLSSYHD